MAKAVYHLREYCNSRERKDPNFEWCILFAWYPKLSYSLQSIFIQKLAIGYFWWVFLLLIIVMGREIYLLSLYTVVQFTVWLKNYYQNWYLWYLEGKYNILSLCQLNKNITNRYSFVVMTTHRWKEHTVCRPSKTLIRQDLVLFISADNS